jgi:hypothetical protein
MFGLFEYSLRVILEYFILKGMYVTIIPIKFKLTQWFHLIYVWKLWLYDDRFISNLFPTILDVGREGLMKVSLI